MAKKNNSNKKIKKVEKEIEEIEEIDDLEEYEEDDEEEVVVKKAKSSKVVEDDDDDDDDEYRVLTVEERLERIEQKQLIVIIVSVVCCILSLITMLFVAGGVNTSSNSNQQQDQQEEESGATYDTSAFKEITASDIKSESKNETIVVMIGRQGCGFCAQYAPVITSVGSDFGITIRYLDISKMSQSDYEIITSLTGNGEWKTFASDNFGYTPETLVIKNNKVVGGIVGAADSAATKNAFETAGLKAKK